MKRERPANPNEEIVELLKSLLIVELGVARVPQNDIRKIVGCGIGRVNAILKYFPKDIK